MIDQKEIISPEIGQEVYVLQHMPGEEKAKAKAYIGVILAVESEYLLIEFPAYRDRWGDSLRRWVSRAHWALSSPATKIVPRVPATSFLSGPEANHRDEFSASELPLHSTAATIVIEGDANFAQLSTPNINGPTQFSDGAIVAKSTLGKLVDR